MIDKLSNIIDYEKEYGSIVELRSKTNSDEYKIKCPFHDDRVESMSINVKKGVFYCHACGAKGNFFQFYAKFHNITTAEVIQSYALQYGLLDPISKKEVDEKHIVLMHDKKALNVFLTKKGITVETCKRFNLGYDGDRFWIPIKDAKGNYINVIRYKITSQKIKDKTLPYSKGRSASLFPLENFKGNEIYLMEGFSDCLLANQLGLNAVTGSGGAKTWKAQWSPLFKDKIVYICYDMDRPGKVGAHRVAAELFGHAKKIYFKFLPDVGLVSPDFNDYIVKAGKSIDDFKAIETVEYKGEDINITEPVEQKDLQIYDVSLAEASDAKYYNKRVRFKAIVSGKLLAPYILPVKGNILCKRNFSEDSCGKCPVTRKEFKGFDISYEDSEVLLLIDCATAVQNAVVKRKVGIPKVCNKCKVIRETNINIEEINLVPIIDFANKESKYVSRTAFRIGTDIETNKTYEFTAITVPEPKTQLATHLIYETKASESNIDKFQVTDDVVKLLMNFRPDSWTVNAMEEKLKEIYSDYEIVTGIKNRHKIFKLIDFTYCSALQFKFQGKQIFRGYLDTLLIGDTRTGKSDSLEFLMQHFRAGEMSTGENMSFAGLVGGLEQQHNGKWSINWGKIVLNHRRLYVIDEIDELKEAFWSKTSQLRSSGVASVTKMRSEKALAQTRLISMGNVPGQNAALSDYNNGIEAVVHIIGKLEDIARFDFVVGVLRSDVSEEIINAKVDKNQKIKRYTSEMCHNLIMYAWSRNEEHIEITDAAEDAILKYALEESKLFHPGIPLVQGAEQRIKLARLSTAIAIRFFSTDKSFKKVIVKPCHVDYAHKFLLDVYGPPLNYEKYSRKQYEKDSIKNEEYLRSILNEDIKEQFLEWDKLKQADLFDIFSDVPDREKVRAIIGNLLRCRAIKRIGTSYYIKTSAFIRFLNNNKFKESKLAIKKEVKF